MCNIIIRVEIQELKLEESGQTIAELTERLKQYEADLERKESVSQYAFHKLIVTTTLTKEVLKVARRGIQ